MNTRKTTGIALKSSKLGEADKIITFLTTEGKVSAVAKGVRRTKSKFGGRLEPGNDLDLVLAHGRTLDTVTQVQISKARLWLRSDLGRLEVACSMLELADKLAPEGTGGDRLLELLGAALDRLEVEARLPLLLLAFDIKALAISGFFPNLSACVICGGKTGLNRLAVAEGALICDRCYGGHRAIKVSRSAKDLIRNLLAARLVNLDSVLTHTGIIEDVRKIIWSHVVYHVRGDFKTRKKEEADGG